MKQIISNCKDFIMLQSGYLGYYNFLAIVNECTLNTYKSDMYYFQFYGMYGNKRLNKKLKKIKINFKDMLKFIEIAETVEQRKYGIFNLNKFRFRFEYNPIEDWEIAEGSNTNLSKYDCFNISFYKNKKHMSKDLPIYSATIIRKQYEAFLNNLREFTAVKNFKKKQ